MAEVAWVRSPPIWPRGLLGAPGPEASFPPPGDPTILSLKKKGDPTINIPVTVGRHFHLSADQPLIAGVRSVDAKRRPAPPTRRRRP